MPTIDHSNAESTPSGLPAMGRLAWGTHLCQFYRSREDLLETLVPYFAAGLAENEKCVWVTSDPLRAADARAALQLVVNDLEARERRGQIEILDHDEWYLRTGDDVLQQWLDRELAALRSGYGGLRITGNTLWLEPESWASFAAYEASVHRAFHSRRIVALCSYMVDRCGSDEIVDILRNHGSALVRRAGVWQVLQGATMVLTALEPEASALDSGHHPAAKHVVRFFDDHQYPTRRVAEWLAPALAEGHAAFAFVTPAHAEDLRGMLQELGVQVGLVTESGQLRFLDAEALARALVSHGKPPKAVFDELVVAPLEAALSRYARVRVYGEVVDVLARAGDTDRAIGLEQWWNDFLGGKAIDLLCGYTLGSFPDAESVKPFRRVCGEHAEVECATSATSVSHERLAAELAHVEAALRRESSRRQELELSCERLAETERAARERAQAMTDRFARLQRLTSALAEVSTPADVARVAASDLTEVFGADSAALAVLDEGRSLRLLGHANVADDLVAKFEVISVDARLPIAEAFVTARPVWVTSRAALAEEYPGLASDRPDIATIGCVPLVLVGDSLGALALVFQQSFQPPAAERALLEDYARHIAIALDRTRSYEQAERAREHAERERQRAEEASRAKDEFLAMLGHELRNPLSPILTAVQLMKLRAGDMLTKERTIIERQVNHMVRLVDDLLDVSRIARGKVELQRAPIELAQIVANAVERASPVLEERTHKLGISIPASGLRVDGDGDRLSQVVVNLLINAAKYTPPRGVVEIRAQRDGADVELSVQDTGIGMDADLLPNVFDLFVQGSQGRDRARGGLGLGLCIARNLVHMHGGSLRAESAGVGKGSTFTIRLPLSGADMPSAAHAIGARALQDLAPLNVLVVDDNIDAAVALADVLQMIGHEVAVAHDAIAALEATEKKLPDLALLDIGLPVMDGYELARQITARTNGRRPRLVAVTGYGRERDRQQAEAAGFDEHLVKPVDFDRLLEVIRQLFPARDLQAATSAAPR